MQKGKSIQGGPRGIGYRLTSHQEICLQDETYAWIWLWHLNQSSLYYGRILLSRNTALGLQVSVIHYDIIVCIEHL